jgi:hypothetical protein
MNILLRHRMSLPQMLQPLPMKQPLLQWRQLLLAKKP